jgi:hypothetical protein
MKICIRIEKDTALLAGKDIFGYIVVDVPSSELTQSQRETLSDFDNIRSNRHCLKDVDYDLSYFDNFFKTYNEIFKFNSEIFGDIVEANIESVKKILDRLTVFKQAKQAEKEDNIRKEKEKEEKEILDFLVDQKTNPDSAFEFDYGRFKPCFVLRMYGEDPRLVALATWAELESGKKNKEIQLKEKEERNSIFTAEKLKKEKEINVLMQWCREFGSPLLKARIGEEYEWIGLAEVEYSENIVSKIGTQLEIPSFESSKESPRTTPKLVEIEAVKLARKLLEGTPSQVDLVWSEYILKDDSKLKRSEIKVTVTCPTGRKLEYYFKSEDA